LNTVALDLLAEARRHGVQLIPTPTGKIKASAPKPPPPDLLVKLKAQRAELAAALAEAETDDFEERAAIVEHDCGIPRAWAEGFARLHPERPLADVSPKRWQQFIDDIGRFLDAGWAEKASALGWGPLDLFGCDRERPFARLDHAGLLWLLNGDRLAELDCARAVIERSTGSQQVFRRRPLAVGEVVLAWELEVAPFQWTVCQLAVYVLVMAACMSAS
jgi:hypothetical protein